MSLSGTAVVVSIPAAFSDTCTQQCVPGVLERLDDIKSAGADQVIVVCSDQPFAINAWVKAEGWADTDVTFASDFGGREFQGVVGKLSDEPGKEELPPLLGHLNRRAYLVIKDGTVTWQKIEDDTTQYTLDVDELIAAL